MIIEILIILVGTIALVSFVIFGVALSCNFRYLRFLRQARKSIEKGDVCLTERGYYHENMSVVPLDHDMWRNAKIKVAAIEFFVGEHKAVAYIKPREVGYIYKGVQFDIVSCNTYPSIYPNLVYLDPEDTMWVVGKMFNKIFYDPYESKVEDYLNTATDAMRI